ncbi:hypothetical protein EPN96_08775 [bacterium]|nr:MAG: hypothetical protein EPN96_08775 [bacterium]
MKSFIKHIGVVDKDNLVHFISLTSGVNVITGKSSTGKSALIEIFDLCFGSSDFTVPEGVITDNAEIYFTVICIKDTNVILARRRGDASGFIKEETDHELVASTKIFKKEYFTENYFIPLPDYKKEIGRCFGLNITDVDLNTSERQYRGGKKSPTPSIRSFTSFMLQHQNLIANKHAIFYRFDEKEKREQTIEHLKIFLGFADQDYFLKNQELNTLMEEQRLIERQIPQIALARENTKNEINKVLQEYLSISGTNFSIGSVDEILRHPQRALDSLKKFKIVVLQDSNEQIIQLKKYIEDRDQFEAKLRSSKIKLESIQSSIKFAKRYESNAAGVKYPLTAEIYASECPFCNASNDAIDYYANRLDEAINWLNEELRLSPYMLESFEEEENKVKKEIDGYRKNIIAINKEINAIETQIKELETYRSQYELALKSKLQIEVALERLVEKNTSDLDTALNEIKEKISKLQNYILKTYNIKSKLK